jgi:2-dehydro-3-deoxyglucarate aldolase/4-hydroxy-2-oxoheptanedioate aldolase
VSWVKTNHVKRALREGRPTSGAWLHLCSAISAEIMSRAGFDWLLIDMEHGHGDLQTLLAQLQAIEGSEAIPVVRVQWNDPAIIKRVLDMGAYGVMVPWIGGRADAEAVRATRTRPTASGIAGSHRAGGHGGTRRSTGAQTRDPRSQVETRTAVEEIDQIVRVPGVDVIFIGPGTCRPRSGTWGIPATPTCKRPSLEWRRRRVRLASPSATSRGAGSRRESFTRRATSS